MIQKYLFKDINPGDLVKVNETWLPIELKGNKWFLVVHKSECRYDVFVDNKRRLSVYIDDVVDCIKVKQL